MNVRVPIRICLFVWFEMVAWIHGLYATVFNYPKAQWTQCKSVCPHSHRIAVCAQALDWNWVWDSGILAKGKLVFRSFGYLLAFPMAFSFFCCCLLDSSHISLLWNASKHAKPHNNTSENGASISLPTWRMKMNCVCARNVYVDFSVRIRSQTIASFSCVCSLIGFV